MGNKGCPERRAQVPSIVHASSISGRNGLFASHTLSPVRAARECGNRGDITSSWLLPLVLLLCIPLLLGKGQSSSREGAGRGIKGECPGAMSNTIVPGYSTQLHIRIPCLLPDRSALPLSCLSELPWHLIGMCLVVTEHFAKLFRILND